MSQRKDAPRPLVLKQKVAAQWLSERRTIFTTARTWLGLTILLVATRESVAEWEWKTASASSDFHQQIQYWGSLPLPEGDWGGRDHIQTHAYSSNAKPADYFFPINRISAWGAEAYTTAFVSYRLEQGSGLALLATTSSVQAQYIPAPTENYPNAVVAARVWSNFGTPGYGAQLSILFDVAEPTYLNYQTNGSASPVSYIGYSEPPLQAGSNWNVAGTVDSYGYFPGENHPPQATVYVLRASTGTPVWETPEGFPLAPGEDYVLEIRIPRTYASVYPGSTEVRRLSANGGYAVSWQLGGTPFLGATPQSPIKIDAYEFHEQVDSPEPTNGANLTFPAQADIGVSNHAYVGLPTTVIGGQSDGALITGFGITSEHLPLTSLIVPQIPAGAQDLTIDFGSGPQPVVAGQTIEFGEEGIDSFTLAGFDPMYASANLDAFVMGLQFAEAGFASLVATPTLYIPPGDFNNNGVGDAADYILWRKSSGQSQEYETWRANFGPPSIGSGTSLSEVPEPTAIALLSFAVAFILKQLFFLRSRVSAV